MCLLIHKFISPVRAHESWNAQCPMLLLEEMNESILLIYVVVDKL